MIKLLPKIFLVFLFITLLFISPLSAAAQVSNPVTAAGEAIANFIGGVSTSVITFPLRVLLYIATYIEGMLIMLAGYLVGAALDFNKTILDFKPPFVPIGWAIFRDIANLGFVFGIILIAISTILRIKKYQAQSILWKLIVAALIVNFSLLIGSAIIKPSTAISDFILQYITNRPTDAIGPSGGGGIDASAKLGDAFRFHDIVNSMSGWSIALGSADFKGALSIIGALAVIALFGLVMLLTLFAFAGMLFIRYFMLSFLLMISPVALLLWIFPGTQKHFKEWWEKFIHWVVYAPFLLLFMYIALLVLDQYTADIATISQARTVSTVDIDFGLLMTSLFAAAILIGGLKTAAKMGHGGTELALGAIDSGQKYAKKWALDRAKRSGAAAAQAPAKIAERFGYKPGTIQSKLFAGASWGKTTTPFFSKKVRDEQGNVIKEVEGQTTGQKAKTLLRSALLGSSQFTAKETAISMGQVSAGLKKVRSTAIDEEKKRLATLSKDQQDAGMGAVSVDQQAAILELQASKNQINKQTFAAFKTADEKRDAMINILQRMHDEGRKDVGDVEKKLVVSKDMLIAQRDGTAMTYKRDEKDPTRIVREPKAFDDLAPSFYGKYSANDWKNYSATLGGQMYDEKGKESHPLGDVVRDAVDGKIMDQIMNPRTPAFQSILSRLPAKQQKVFFERVQNEIKDRVASGKMTQSDADLMDEKMKNVQKYLSSFIPFDSPSGGGSTTPSSPTPGTS